MKQDFELDWPVKRILEQHFNKRALRRHHRQRLFQKRKSYNNIYVGSRKRIGIAIDTPKNCSCRMCGNSRKYHGLSYQELAWNQTALEEF